MQVEGSKEKKLTGNPEISLPQQSNEDPSQIQAE